MRSLHNAAGGALGRLLNKVVAKLRPNWADHLTFRSSVDRRLKGVYHTKDREKTQVTSALCAVGVGAQGGKGLKRLAAIQAIINGHQAVECLEGVARQGVFSAVYHDMACANVKLHTFVGLINKAVVDALVG